MSDLDNSQLSRVDGPIACSFQGCVLVVMGLYQEVAKGSNFFPLFEAINYTGPMQWLSQ